MLTNPASGHGNAPHAAEKAIARLQQRGVDVVAIVGSDAEHARRLLHDALDKGTDALVVVGGDGVIADALQALAETRHPARHHPGRHRQRPRPRIRFAHKGSRRRGRHHRRRLRSRPSTSAGSATPTAPTKWFGTVMAAGFDSLVTDRTNRMRWPHGRMRYNLAMVAELSKLRLLPFRLVLDGGEEIVTDLTLAAFGNTRSYGGGMLICPNADPPTAYSTSPWCTRRRGPG